MSSVPSRFTFPNGQVFTTSGMSQMSVQAMFQQLVMQMLNIVVDPTNEDAAYRQVRCGYQTDGQPAWTGGENVIFVIARTVKSQYSKQRDEFDSIDPDFDSTATLVSGNPVIMVSTNNYLVAPGQMVVGTGLPDNDVVLSVDGFQVTLSKAPTISSPSSPVTFKNVMIQRQMLVSRKWSLKFVFYGADALQRGDLVSSSFGLDWPNEFLKFPPQPYTSSFFIVPEYWQPIYVPENFQKQWWTRYDLDLEFYEKVDQSVTIPTATSVQVAVNTEDGVAAQTTINAA